MKTNKILNVNVEAMMDMSGTTMNGEMIMNMMNMMGGNCNVNYNLPMQGNWKCTVHFNNGLSVQFLINVI